MSEEVIRVSDEPQTGEGIEDVEAHGKQGPNGMTVEADDVDDDDNDVEAHGKQGPNG
jgi:hypothetical protein